MANHRLPPELLEIILDNLHPSNDDWHASWPKAKEVRQPLSACTLVSRSWYALAREHLFRDVVYSFRRPAKEGIETWTSSDVQGRWQRCPAAERQKIKHLPLKTLGMLVDFLERSPAIRSCIRRLCLACYPALDNRTGLRWCGYDLQNRDAVKSTMLPSLLNSLPRLMEFRAWNIFISTSFVPTPSVPAVSLEKTVILYTVPIPKARRTCRLLTCFDTVNELVIINPSHGDIGIVPDKDHLSASFPAAVPLNTYSLTLSYVRDYPVVHCISALLSRSPSAQNLRSLILDTMSFQCVPGIEVLLRNVGARLEYLRLTMYTFGDDPYSNEIFDLSRITGLKELAIGLSPDMHSPRFCAIMMKIGSQYFRTTVVSPTTNPHLQKITFCFGYGGYYTDHLIDDGWWDDPGLRHHIQGFETHFIGLVGAFGLEGIHFECYAHVFPERRELPGVPEMLRRIGPLVFQEWSRENLLIMAENPSSRGTLA